MTKHYDYAYAVKRVSGLVSEMDHIMWPTIGDVSLCLRKLVNPRSRADGHIVTFALGKITSDDHIEDSTRSKCLTKAADANRKGSQKMGAPSKDGFRRMKLAEHRMLSESAKIFEQL